MVRYVHKLSDKQISLLLAVIVLLVVVALFVPIVIITINQLVNKGETRYIEYEVNRVEKLIQHELLRLDKSVSDWANWDETYQFAKDANQDFIGINTADNVFGDLNIDFFLVCNPSGDILFVKYVDNNTGFEAPLPIDPDLLLQTYPSILIHYQLDSSHTGLATIQGQQLLFASRPILTSFEEGPASGTLIFLRLLDNDAIDQLSELAQRKINLFSIHDMPKDIPDQPAPSVILDQILVYARNSKIVEGYKYIPDFNGLPLMVLQVVSPRDLYHQGTTTARIFSGIIILLGISLFSGTYHFTRTFVKSRKLGQKISERFQAVVLQSSESILLVDEDFNILESNLAGKELLGWQPDTTLAAIETLDPHLKSFLTFEPDLDLTLIREICDSGSVAEFHCIRHDTRPLDLELSATMIQDTNMQTYSLIIRDVTARKEAEIALKASEERYMLAVNGANDGLWDWDLMEDQIYFSPRWKAMLGYEADEIPPVPEEWFNRVHSEDLLNLRTQLSNHLRNRTPIFQYEYRMRHKDGRYVWVLARGVAVWDTSGFACRIAGSLTDIDDRKVMENQLRFDALHDSLTGLGNRTMLIDRLHHLNERKKRKPELLYALFFLDLDRFKQINDTYGHQAGDQLLVLVAERLNTSLRSADTITRHTGPGTLARIAGDEFVILIEDVQSSEVVDKIAERLLTILCEPYYIENQEVVLTASIGLIVPEAAYAEVEDVIRDADIAMYKAKQAGGAKLVRFMQTMYQGALDRMQLENDLRKAIEQREFEVYYQPIYTLDSDDIAGFEALVRWNHPAKGILLPGEFIKAAEEIGLIAPIGLFVLEESCRQMQLWQKELKITPELMISVNLSVRQLVKSQFVDDVRKILTKTGFDPKKLWLEVTESILLENNEEILKQLNELRSLGIKIEIDDFGTGYSSLSYLQNLPIDGFKIDRSFVKDINNSGKQIVKTLVELGHSLGLTQVAEGVETETQREFLKEVSCDFAQGYLMSKPVTASSIEDMLAILNGKG